MALIVCLPFRVFFRLSLLSRRSRLFFRPLWLLLLLLSWISMAELTQFCLSSLALFDLTHPSSAPCYRLPLFCLSLLFLSTLTDLPFALRRHGTPFVSASLLSLETAPLLMFSLRCTLFATAFDVEPPLSILTYVHSLHLVSVSFSVTTSSISTHSRFLSYAPYYVLNCVHVFNAISLSHSYCLHAIHNRHIHQLSA